MDADLSALSLTGQRVVHVSTVHRSNDARIRHKECGSLAAHGADVTLIARSSGLSLADDGIYVIDVPEFASRRGRMLKAGWFAAKQVNALRADVVHFHDPELLLFAPLFRRGGVAVVYDVHENLPQLIMSRQWIHGGLRSFISKAANRIEPLLARFCHGLVLVEPSWAPRFADRPTAICRNYPLRREFPDATEHTPPDTPHFVYVGDITKARGALVATQAVNTLSQEATLTLAGPVASEQLRSEIKALDKKGRVHLPGFIDRNQVQQLLASATAGLVLLDDSPAYDTAVATKIFEYMGAGIPMILSNTTAHRKVASDHGCAVLTDFDAPQAADAMHQFIIEQDKLAKMAIKSRQAFEQMPVWEDDATDLLRLYQELTSLT